MDQLAEISAAALVARINRKLRHVGQCLHKTYGWCHPPGVFYPGHFYVADRKDSNHGARTNVHHIQEYGRVLLPGGNGSTEKGNLCRSRRVRPQIGRTFDLAKT